MKENLYVKICYDILYEMFLNNIMYILGRYHIHILWLQNYKDIGYNNYNKKIILVHYKYPLDMQVMIQ